MSELRIIAGQWRGRRIAVPAAGVRPTADRVREAWMSIIQPHIPDARVLDLCAGSGALGLECLSRGAEHCDFVEQDPKVLRVLQGNIETLGATPRSTVHKASAPTWLEQQLQSQWQLPSPLPSPLQLHPSSVIRPYQLALADPPYASDLAERLATIWLTTPFSDIFCIEHASSLTLPAPADAAPDRRRYGETALTIYRAPPLMPKTALYAGSFDPITNGHADLIRRSLQFVDRLIVGVAVNVAKQPLFAEEERVALIRAAVEDDPRVEVRAFKGLVVNFAQEVGAKVILRGLRAVADFEYEYQMALMNRHLAPGIETIFMVPSLEVSYLSSSLVREVARFGGDIDKLVHPAVAKALRGKF